MENRKPFELRKILIVYNFLQVLFSIWLFNEASSTGWLTGYSFRCQPVDYSQSPTALRVSAIYLYYCHTFFFKFLFWFFLQYIYIHVGVVGFFVVFNYQQTIIDHQNE